MFFLMATKSTPAVPKGFIALVNSTRSKNRLASLYHSLLGGKFRATNPKTIRRQRRALRDRISTVGLPILFS